MKLNEKIIEILKQHPEGEPFFDALDAMIRGDLDVLGTFMNFVESKLGDTQNCTLVLTGQFGNAIISLFGSELFEKFADVILVNGGIRIGEKPVIFRQNLKATQCIMLDDSYYSGKTRNDIETALRIINVNARISHTFVIYDGSKNRKANVFSMFRYYDHPEISTLEETL